MSHFGIKIINDESCTKPFKEYKLSINLRLNELRDPKEQDEQIQELAGKMLEKLLELSEVQEMFDNSFDKLDEESELELSKISTGKGWYGKYGWAEDDYE